MNIIEITRCVNACGLSYIRPDLSAMCDPVLRGWQRYYGRFYESALKPVWRSMNLFLIRWLMRKHKHLAGHKTRAAEMLERLAHGQPDAFIHWSLGFVP